MRKTNSPNGPGTSGAPSDDAPVVERDDRDRAARQARITDGAGPGAGPVPPAPADPPPAPGAALPHRQHDDDAEPYGSPVLPVRGAAKSSAVAASAAAGTRSSSTRQPAARRTTARRAGADDDALLDPGAGEELTARLRDTLSTFVDSPAEAVADADEVTAQVAQLATDAIQARRAELERLRRDAGEDTEQLRLALQKHRAFVQAMLKL